MRNIAALPVSACVVFAALPANADWQFTKWWMTPDEVIVVSGGSAGVAAKPVE